MILDRPSSFRTVRRLASAALATAALGACQPDRLPDKPAIEVRTEVVAYSDYAPSIVLTGEIAARVMSDLSFRVGGRITERKVEIGAHVTGDEVLATIDPQEQLASLDAAQANVQAAQAQLRQASSTYDRQKTLITRGYTTRRETDQAEEAFRSAQGALDVANAQLGTARDQLSYTVLRAGVPGIVTARVAEAGEVVQAAQRVFTLAQDGPRDAVFDVYESVFTQEPAGDTIEVALVSDPRVTARAKLREISPTVDPQNGTVKVKFEVADPPPAMGLGAAIVGTAALKPRGVVVLPWNALTTHEGAPAVWVVDQATKAVSLRRVEVEGYELRTVLVKDGLRPGEVVVTDGQQLLRPSQVVASTERPR